MKKINGILLLIFIIFSLKIYAVNDFETLKATKIDRNQISKIFEIVKMNYGSNSFGEPVYDQIFSVMINNNEFIFFPTDDVPPVNSNRETHCDINILSKTKAIQEAISRPSDEIKSIYFFKRKMNSSIWFVTIITTLPEDNSTQGVFFNAYAYMFNKDKNRFESDDQLDEFLYKNKVKNISEFKKYFSLYYRDKTH